MSPAKIEDKILFVDDEPNVLASFLRQLRKKFTLDTALSAKEALKLLEEKGPYAVAVSDLKMPGMSGIEFLAQVKTQAPDTVRILLTGFADANNAIDAVNQGSIFRFLTKPCDTETLVRALVDGVKQNRLLSAEKDLLQNTLAGSIKVLTEILSLLHPQAVGRSSRIKDISLKIAERMDMTDTWALDSAAMLSQLGMIALPPEALQKLEEGHPLAADEEQVLQMHPLIGSDLIKHIPRMGGVAEIISRQNDPYPGDQVPLESRIIKVAHGFDILQSQGIAPPKAIRQMREEEDKYDPKVLKALAESMEEKPKESSPIREVNIKDLTESMVFVNEVRTAQGKLVVPQGQRVTRLLVRHLENHNRSFKINEPLLMEIRPLE